MPDIRHRGEEKEFDKSEDIIIQRRDGLLEQVIIHGTTDLRKLLIRYEKKSENYLALVCLVVVLLS